MGNLSRPILKWMRIVSRIVTEALYFSCLYKRSKRAVLYLPTMTIHSINLAAMTRDTHSPDIYTLFSQCITHIDTILLYISYQPASFKANFPLKDDIRDIRQDLNQWGIRYGADRSVFSTLSLDYKFRKQDYTRSTIQSQLGNLAEDLEGRKLSCSWGMLRTLTFSG